MRIRDNFNIVNNESKSFSCEWFCSSLYFESSLKPSTHSSGFFFALFNHVVLFEIIYL